MTTKKAVAKKPVAKKEALSSFVWRADDWAFSTEFPTEAGAIDDALDSVNVEEEFLVYELRSVYKKNVSAVQI